MTDDKIKWSKLSIASFVLMLAALGLLLSMSIIPRPFWIIYILLALPAVSFLIGICAIIFCLREKGLRGIWLAISSIVIDCFILWFLYRLLTVKFY